MLKPSKEEQQNARLATKVDMLKRVLPRGWIILTDHADDPVSLCVNAIVGLSLDGRGRAMVNTHGQHWPVQETQEQVLAAISAAQKDMEQDR